MAAQYDRAVGKPPCRYGKECRRANLQHWSDYDHPPNHPRLSAGADFGLPPVPLPQYPMPVCIDISASDDEDAGHVSARPEGTGFMVDRGRTGLIHFRIASSGPQDAVRYLTALCLQLLMSSTGVRQDGAAAAAAAAVAVAAPPPEAAALGVGSHGSDGRPDPASRVHQPPGGGALHSRRHRQPGVVRGCDGADPRLDD